jgi:hypothetical protein
MDGASSEEIIRVVKLCPTQALSFAYNNALEQDKEKSGKDLPNPEKIPEIRVMENGPFVLYGDFHIIDTEGNKLKPMKMLSLCRCGSSLSMPYCDGMHRKTGFTGK